MKQLGYALRRRPDVWVCSLLLVLVACALAKNLDAAALWDDEAEVAIFARNLASTGELTAWDGRNLFAFRNGTTTDEDLTTKQPPLMFYLAALSFKIFGVSTLSARLPFVACGLAAVAWLWAVMRRHFAQMPTVAPYTVACFGLNVSFLLSSRQCRYYAPCMLCAVMAFDFYRRCLRGPTVSRSLALALTCMAMFLANYLVGGAFVMTVAALHLADRSSWSRRSNLALIGSGCAFTAVCGAYAYAHRIWERADLPAHAMPWYLARPLSVAKYLRDLNEINVLPAFGLLGILWLAWHQAQSRRAVLSLTLLALINAVFIGWFTPQPYREGEPADVRYLVASLPFAAGALAFVAAALHRRHVVLGLAATAAVLSCTGLSFNHELRFRWLLPAYMKEITSVYPTAQAKAAEAIAAHAAKDDLVMTVPDFESLPLMFYAGEKVRLCCLVNANSPLVQSGAVARLGAPLRIDAHFPDWIVAFGSEPYLPSLLEYMSRPHLEGGRTRRYRYDQVQRLDVYHRSTQRSELPFHEFAAMTDYDRSVDDVYLWRRSRVE